MNVAMAKSSSYSMPKEEESLIQNGSSMKICNPPGPLEVGEEIEFIGYYDLFGNDISGMTGIVVAVDSHTNKPLVYVKDVDDWCEPEPSIYQRSAPGVVTQSSRNFLATTYRPEWESIRPPLRG